ncbi:P-loop containing nucleoside triphosphate hydrolase protein [Podospora appendiculata]|uniref:P-loop containing nucleoside triphosphate hydrolase protein n=1 Tax=Podospora appendiculata TaxID=314037 RepID=A0AAE0WZ24_9PEZI|nr:P-loop containing nucleoside triphosphate hydrolase protein [Podospora appendiculata]
MDQPTAASVTMPRKKKSKAIPIVNPACPREVQIADALVSQKAAREEAARAAENVRAQILTQHEAQAQPQLQPEPHHRQTVAAGSHSQSASSAEQGANSNSKADKDSFEPGFDVYARPFVPEVYKTINIDPGRVFAPTPQAKAINFSAYARESLTTALLPQIPLHIDASVVAQQSVLQDEPSLKPKQYERFFRLHLQNEMQCQERENASYALYSHEGLVQFGSEAEAKVTITVPGLREFTPYVEDDDCVQLRQLRGDRFMNPSQVLEYSQYPNMFRGPWTGFIYDARISAVVRAKKALILRVSGLTPLTSELFMYGGYHPQTVSGQTYTLRFNIQFPLVPERYHPMEDVLAHIQASLLQASDATDQQVNTHLASTDDFSPDISSTNQYWIQSMLFPTEADGEAQDEMHPGPFTQRFFDGALNFEQRLAVENICHQNYGAVPYLISGPPGTGKTKTIIEIALQLIFNVENTSHILLCAPSESATDTLADRLRPILKPHEMLRLNRPTRSFAELNDTVMPYCYIVNDSFDLPPFHQLMSYKVIVTSCRDTSMLMYARVTNTDLYAVENGLRLCLHPIKPPSEPTQLHWDALLIDEAAQSTEPESLIPLYVVAPPSHSPKAISTPLVIMAGDEQQLTPRTSSPSTPLKRSLFARLFARPNYANHPLARHFNHVPPPLLPKMLPILRPAFTNLIRNYRSHPSILAAPSRVFYHDTLVTAAEVHSRNQLLAWDKWPQPTIPLLFHDNPSPDVLELEPAHGSGWFNPGEARLAVAYAAALSASRLLPDEQICVTSPFKAQVRLLRQLARERGLWRVNIGPTEAFQGLEYGLVILCVTRSRKRFVERDRELGWGVVGMPNLMNVALTRAKSGLVVIGAGEVVDADEDWRAVVDMWRGWGCVVQGEGVAGRAS